MISVSTIISFIKNNKNTEDSKSDIEKINSIWLECDTQNEEGVIVKGGDGTLNNVELARFKVKLLETSKTLFEMVLNFFNSIGVKNESNTAVVDEEAGIRTYFDDEGNITIVQDLAYTKSKNYTYNTDKNGKQYIYASAHTDENGLTTSYDSEGNITGHNRQTNKDGKYIYESFDKDMNLTEKTVMENGITTEYRADGSIEIINDSNKKEIQYFDKNNKLIKTHSYKYISEPDDNDKFSDKLIAKNLEVLNYYNGSMEGVTEKYKSMLSNINAYNVLNVLKEYSKISDFNRMFSDNIALNYGEELKDIIIEKSKILIQCAKQHKLYTADYEKYINDAIKKNNISELAIAMDRLSERILKGTDTEKVLRASKREKGRIEANGIIDGDFAQGYTGDCWLISAIISIKQNPDTLEQLNKKIHVKYEADGKTVKEITVNIKGKNYVISAEELNGAIEYSSGDLDVRAIEIAVNRYYHENGLGDIANGGSCNNGWEILLGDILETNYYGAANDNFIEQIKEDNILCSAGSNVDIDSDYTGYYGIDKDGNKVEIYNHHAYNIVKADDNYVYIINPWDSNNELQVTIEDFKSIFGAHSSIQYAKIKTE